MSDLGTPAFTWGELRALVRCAGPDSALYREHDWAPHTWQLELLRQIELSLRALDWRIVTLFKRGVRVPTPARFPWEEPGEDEAITGDAMTLEETADWLGWDIEGEVADG